MSMTSPGIPIREILVDPRIVPRADMDEERVLDHIQDLADELEPGTDLRPVVVFREGARRYWIASGICTLRAYEARERTRIPAEIHLGGYRDALLYSAKANAEWIALKRTQADRRRSVNKLLDDPEWGELPNRQLAKLAGVSEGLVRIMREERGDEPEEDEGGGNCVNTQRRSDLLDLARALKQLGQSPAKMVRQLIVAGVPEAEWRPPVEQLIGLIRRYGGAAATEHLEKLERTIASITEELQDARPQPTADIC